MCRSDPHTPAAPTATRASSGPCSCGSGTSRRATWPGASKVSARMTRNTLVDQRASGAGGKAPGGARERAARAPDRKALGVIDAQLAQQLDRLGVADELRHGLLAQGTGKLRERADHHAVAVAARQVADEVAVDLDHVEGQLRQVLQRAEARAKVVEGDATAK